MVLVSPGTGGQWRALTVDCAQVCGEHTLQKAIPWTPRARTTSLILMPAKAALTTSCLTSAEPPTGPAPGFRGFLWPPVLGIRHERPRRVLQFGESWSG